MRTIKRHTYARTHAHAHAHIQMRTNLIHINQRQSADATSRQCLDDPTSYTSHTKYSNFGSRESLQRPWAMQLLYSSKTKSCLLVQLRLLFCALYSLELCNCIDLLSAASLRRSQMQDTHTKAYTHTCSIFFRGPPPRRH